MTFNAIEKIPVIGALNKKKVVSQIRRRCDELSQHSHEQLLDFCLELKFEAKGGRKPKALLVDAFALAHEATVRTLGLRLYDVQLLAGINLVSNQVVEMATGEGKTLTAIMPLFLYSLYGKGSLLATANDYLAKRDEEQVRPVFECLGLRSGIVQNASTPENRAMAYKCDVTYGTLSEFGFDFLRDRISARNARQSVGVSQDTSVCRPPYFVLIDEADSIMIDDASTPLIIGASIEETDKVKKSLYEWSAPIAKEAISNERLFRYLDHATKIELTEAGRTWARQRARDSKKEFLPVDIYEYLERAIKVERNYKKDKDYVIKDGGISIVDQNTGRLSEDRFWQDGIHQAIQAREKMDITAPSATAARVTIQSFVLSFPNRAGMTGTAMTSAKEFKKVYKMDVVRIPTRKAIRRHQLATVYRKNLAAKETAIVESVQQLKRNGIPVLIGTRTVETSERLSELLTSNRIEHEVLNARHEESEAAIIAKAGHFGVVTIATSMAGRGTDIKPDADALAKGGLHVLITELHDSRRIDLQLLGRSARQGDPGVFQFFLSAEDKLFSKKEKTNGYRRLLLFFGFLCPLWVARLAQRKIDRKKTQDRLAMLENEKKRLRSIRQAGLDPILDVVD